MRWRSAERSGRAADWLLVGLGNPGPKFEGTRHNAGFEVLGAFAARHQIRLASEPRLRALVGAAPVADSLVALAQPLTFMNESGQPLRAVMRRFGVTGLDHLVVVHDELDLEPGQLRLKSGGGLAGHNGLRSIRDCLDGDEFVRVRIGIGRPPGPTAGYVLSRPGKDERTKLDRAVADAVDALDLMIAKGPEAAMNLFNQRRGVDG